MVKRALLPYVVAAVLVVLAGGPVAAQCKASPGAPLDDSYSPAAPKRAVVGSGLVVTGTIRASSDCLPIAGATVEYWMAGPNGYTEKLRGTVVTDKNGRYRFQCPFPVSHGFSPHIHMNVAGDAFLPIQTEFFPAQGSTSGSYDVVLDPAD